MLYEAQRTTSVGFFFFLPLARPQRHSARLLMSLIEPAGNGCVVVRRFRAMDLFRQVRKYQQMKMSKQDLKDEMKQVRRKSAEIKMQDPAYSAGSAAAPHDEQSTDRDGC